MKNVANVTQKVLYGAERYRNAEIVFHRRRFAIQASGLEGNMQLFVRPGLNTLALGSQRWLILGFPAPANAMEMASSGMEGRNKVTDRKFLYFFLVVIQGM
jgi:hypothetical protein